MSFAAEIVHCVALVGGGSVAARLLILRPLTVEQLVEQLDLKLAARISEIAENGRFDEIEWHNMSLFEIDRQARLLTRIAVELAKVYPEQFEHASNEQKRALHVLRRREFMTLVPSFESRRAAIDCLRSFAELFNRAECLIVRFDSMQQANL